MAFDFSAITLEVIDINTNADPDLYVNVNGLTFSKRILEDMNYPQNVQYCSDPAHSVFAIRACKSNEARATSFCKPRAEQTSTFSSGNKNLKEVVCKMIPNYDRKKRYKVTGHYDPDSKTMFFVMTEAEVSEFRKTPGESEE